MSSEGFEPVPEPEIYDTPGEGLKLSGKSALKHDLRPKSAKNRVNFFLYNCELFLKSLEEIHSNNDSNQFNFRLAINALLNQCLGEKAKTSHQPRPVLIKKTQVLGKRRALKVTREKKTTTRKLKSHSIFQSAITGRRIIYKETKVFFIYTLLLFQTQRVLF